MQQAGLALVLLGELVRKAGIVTARHNFTHVVQLTRRPQHELVTRGVYAYVRHPGYLGWLLWSVGTQVMLLNPVCTLAFAVAVRSTAAADTQARALTPPLPGVDVFQAPHTVRGGAVIGVFRPRIQPVSSADAHLDTRNRLIITARRHPRWRSAHPRLRRTGWRRPRAAACTRCCPLCSGPAG